MRGFDLYEQILANAQRDQNLAWPTGQKFFIYIIPEFKSPTSDTKEFEELLKKAFNSEAPSAIQLEYTDVFERESLGENEEYLNISFKPIGYDFPHGTGTNMLRP